jgi:hypothetical protein
LKKEKRILLAKIIWTFYTTTNWEASMKEGFLENSIIVAYYTRDKKLEDRLQKCIASFKYN